MERLQIELDVDLADLDSAYEFRGKKLPHVVLNGHSGSGKSTNLCHVALRYAEREYTVIWREMGKHDLLSRFQTTQDIIDYYKSEVYTGEYRDKCISFWENYQLDHDSPFVVISSIEEIQVNKINIIVWDILKECASKAILIQQYYEFFKQLRESREVDWTQSKLVVILDEANHLLPTLSKNPFREVKDLVIEQTWWLSQWRGFLVRFFLGTHSLTQLNKDARLQCPMILMKASYRDDIREILKRHLSHLAKDELKDIEKQIAELAVNQVLFIDESRKLMFLHVPWIPEKYDLEEILEFVFQFNPKPIVQPIEFTFKGAKKLAEHLFDLMTAEDLEKLFFIQQIAEAIEIKLKVHQFYDFLSEHKELSYLFAKYSFLDALQKGILTLFENIHLEDIKEEYDKKELNRFKIANELVVTLFEEMTPQNLQKIFSVVEVYNGYEIRIRKHQFLAFLNQNERLHQLVVKNKIKTLIEKLCIAKYEDEYASSIIKKLKEKKKQKQLQKQDKENFLLERAVLILKEEMTIQDAVYEVMDEYGEINLSDAAAKFSSNQHQIRKYRAEWKIKKKSRVCNSSLNTHSNSKESSDNVGVVS